MDHNGLVNKLAGQLRELRQKLEIARDENLTLEIALINAQSNQGHPSGTQANQQAAAGQEVTRLRAELETKEKRIDGLEQAVASKDGELETKRVEVDGLRASEQQARYRAIKLEQELKSAREQAQTVQSAHKNIKEEDDNARTIELLRTQLAEGDFEMEKLRADLEASTSELHELKSVPHTHQAELEAELHEAYNKYQDKVILLGIRDKKITELKDSLKICESEKVSFETKFNVTKTDAAKFKKELKEMKKANEQRYAAPFGGSQPPITESYSQMKKRPSPYTGMQGHDPKRSKSFSTQASEHEDDEEPNGEEHKVVVGRGREGDKIRDSPYQRRW